MTDRELLELAAKAAGYKMHIVARAKQDGTVAFYMEPSLLYWNPLTDDGDALRLAVKMNFDIHHREVVWASLSGRGFQVSEPYGDDRCAATRRAIVRAAAEIGRSGK